VVGARGDGQKGQARLYRAALTVGLVLISACTSVPPSLTSNRKTIENSRAAFSSEDRACRALRKIAVIRYIDPIDDALTFDCVER
jgi:hypothetical protein